VTTVAAAVLLGLISGSFLNVCIHRLPRGGSVVRPRSACPRCRGTLAWHDNVPLLSYLWLLGRCRRCGAPIEPLYPAIEAANGALWGALVARFGAVPSTLLPLAFASAVLALLVIDARHRILPNAITLPGIAVGLGTSFASPLVTLPEAIAGAAAGWGIPWLLSAAYRRLRGREGMGMGDLKMLAMVGAFLGWKGVLFTLGAGSILGTVVGVPWALARGEGLQAALPFGAFLGAAALADLFGAREAVLAALGMAG
jgi:leader peptidase (prepilin peptidase)/N-methyltransferase